jgi:hypothetical protein
MSDFYSSYTRSSTIAELEEAVKQSFGDMDCDTWCDDIDYDDDALSVSDVEELMTRLCEQWDRANKHWSSEYTVKRSVCGSIHLRIIPCDPVVPNEW